LNDHIALDLAEPQLNLLELGRVCWGEVQVNRRVRFEELFDWPALVRRESVGDDVDLFAARLVDHDIGEKGDKLRRRLPLGGLARDFASLRVEGGVERQGAVPVVFKTAPYCTPRRERQHRVIAIKGLTGCVLIDAERRSMRRRVQLQADDVRRLGLKVWIIRGHIALNPMRLQAVLAPHAGHPSYG
jgi:hypothetical protein